MQPRPQTRMLAVVLAGLGLFAGGSQRQPAPVGDAGNGCITCHTGIEDIHPGFPLTCVDCHGGDAGATDKASAHVAPVQPPPGDERVLPRNHDLAWQRFENPSNLRVAQQVCGDCHGDLVAHLEKSLHGTTAGHLGDGYYECAPSWGAKPFPKGDRSGKFVTLASGFAEDADALPIRTDARVLGATLKAGQVIDYPLGAARKGYLVPAVGAVEINGVRVEARDGVAISDEAALKIKALEDAEVVMVDAA